MSGRNLRVDLTEQVTLRPPAWNATIAKAPKTGFSGTAGRTFTASIENGASDNGCHLIVISSAQRTNVTTESFRYGRMSLE